MVLTLEIFQFEKSYLLSGNSVNDEQPWNNPSIPVTLEVSHLEILGNLVNDEHLENKLFISITFDVFHFEISGNNVNDEQL